MYVMLLGVSTGIGKLGKDNAHRYDIRAEWAAKVGHRTKYMRACAPRMLYTVRRSALLVHITSVVRAFRVTSPQMQLWALGVLNSVLRAAYLIVGPVSSL